MQVHAFFEKLMESDTDLDNVEVIAVPVRELLIMMRDGLVKYTPGTSEGKGRKTFLDRPIISTTGDRYYIVNGEKREL